MKRLPRVCLVALFLCACGGDDEKKPDAMPVSNADAATATPDAAGATVDAGAPDAGNAAQVARGEYLVLHVAACVDCHTPRNPDGSLDTANRLLAGEGTVPFADLDPADPDVGAIYVRNLTPDATGLASWTDEEIKNAFQNGVKKNGSALFPVMPYFVFHNMTNEDADAVVAYLRSIPAVDNAIPPRQPLGFPFDTPADPIPVAMIPDSTLVAGDPHYDQAQAGKYLATMAGPCIECHTPPSMPPATVPIDLTATFTGGRVFEAADLGLPVPPFPSEIFTRNLTPAANGIMGWTALQVQTALQTGIDENGDALCPPMPAGPMGAFGGLTDEDALAIGYYLTTLAPVDSADWPECTPPAGP